MDMEPIFTNRTFKVKSKTCFLLMPFKLSWSDRVHREIKNILNNAGYSCERADDLYGHDILEDIWIAINEANLIIADVTSKNPNVMYEIGIAHTLGKQVILLTQEIDDIPFDFRRYRHIEYEDIIDGFSKLKQELPKYL